MDRIQLKAKAKQQIRGNIGILFVIALIIGVISTVASAVLGFIPIVGAIVYSVLISPAFTLSFIMVYINLVAGKKPEAGDAFNGFYDFWSAFKVQFFVGLFTFLWSLLFIVPGIVKAYSYSMAMNVLAENPGMPALEAIRRSKEMTEGRKMDLFVLELSFLGWELVGVITFGIAYIWVIPYMCATFINYYNAMKPAAEEPVWAEAIEAPAPEEPVTEKVEDEEPKEE